VHRTRAAVRARDSFSTRRRARALRVRMAGANGADHSAFIEATVTVLINSVRHHVELEGRGSS
jgi:hypothetical protein